MAKINSYKDLLVWQKAIDLSVEIDKLTEQFPSKEQFGLTSQIRRASNSISLNIAEGFGRNSTKSYISFLRNAKGSLDEVESGLVLAVRLGFIDGKSVESINEIISTEMKMLVSLINTLKGKIINKEKELA